MTQRYLQNLFLMALITIGVSVSLTLTACNRAATPAPVDVEATVAAGIAATQQAQGVVQATVEAAIAATRAAEEASDNQLADQVSATEAAPTPVQITPTPAPAEAEQLPDPQAVRRVIISEVNGAKTQDLALLEAIYAPDAVVIDRSGTPNDPGDDTSWRGWANIERRYLEFFSAGISEIELIDLSIQVMGERAIGTHSGVILDGTPYEDVGLYTLEKFEDEWLITQLEYGNKPSRVVQQPSPTPQDSGLYLLEVGSQHRYEEPWGWDRGDPCEAWRTGNFDDTKPNYRGFNIELLLTNNADTKVPDEWPITFTTHKGQTVKACPYQYEGAGPDPGATNSMTFFTVVEKGDYVEKITFRLDDQTIKICLDGKGGWRRC